VQHLARFWQHVKLDLKHYQNTFNHANLRGRFAIVFSTLLMAGGLLTNQIVRGFVKFFIHFLMIFYFGRFGFGFILGTQSFRTLNVRLYSLILLGLWLYLYYKNLKDTLHVVQEGSYPKPIWIQKIQSSWRERIKAFKDYRMLFKHANLKTKFRLISPFVFMGLDQFLRKGYVKGILLFGIQVSFILYMSMIGLYDLMDLIALDTTFLPPEFIRPSTFNLVYGLLAILIVFVFLYLYIKNIKTVTIHIKNHAYALKPFLLELKELKDHKLYVTLLTFPILGILAFTVLPLVFMISIAFTSYQGSGQHFSWQGFDVFKDLLLISDNLYTLISVIEWTLIWAFFATFTNYFGGILLATLINKKGVKGKKIWRTVFIITMATPQFVSLLIMNQMFAFNGPVNQFLLNLNLIETGINFWGNQTNARILIIIVNMWVGIPYLMLLTSGILMNIPEELYEAAIIEGASKRQLFMKVTMPYMLFITTPLLVTGFIHNINNFNVIYLLTQGKPLGVGLVNAGGTDILITWLYQLTRSYRLYNLSAAIGIIIFIISASISLSIYRRTASYQREGEFA
jgi:arabinogalactan oligomer / maltooligosaccharide transport system permease protein